ncbi:hypothetical protein V6N13_123494 [Hibiscus sabdariffa]|uniref:CCT domain-containing protein n=1 Tax=Hibiscus sabdariffa TaxID=183260 RepID=A0ABR2QTM4_9ROSI
MCNKNNSIRRSKRKPKSRSFSLKHSRKTRSKTRKPKYLSLHRLEENLPQMSLPNNDDDDKEISDKQLNLFPLHPENLVEDRDTQYDNVSLLFNTTEEDGDHAVTLNGLLDSEGSESYKNGTATTTATVTSEENPLSPSLTYGRYSCDDRTRLSLVRTAMKGKKERDESEERWVVYSEVVEKKEMEEVSSGDGGCDGSAWWSKRRTKKLLALKLDYEQIMNAWSDKGPLYIEGESPQTVPHLHEASANIFADGLGSASNVWTVPEMASGLKIKEENDGKEDWKKGHREASVLRYKEKRQNRLFSKRVRYEVRKLNAEKRPRVKGRFVKRD